MCYSTRVANSPEDAGKPIEPSKLQGMLADYQKAYQEEYRLATEEASNGERDGLLKKAGKDLDELVPSAISQIAYLMENAESESVRASLAKYIIQSRIGQLLTEASSADPLEALIKKLTAEAEGDKEKASGEHANP